MLMTLHDPNDVMQFADRVLVIGNGTIGGRDTGEHAHPRSIAMRI